jgi:hypothetical protein
MQNNATDVIDSTDFDRRTERALTERMSVVDIDGTPLAGDETLVRVITTEGGDYRTDVQEGRCTCPDAKHRDPEGGCKHLRRARIALGRQPISADTLLDSDADAHLGAHVESGPAVLAADGGSND